MNDLHLSTNGEEAVRVAARAATLRKEADDADWKRDYEAADILRIRAETLDTEAYMLSLNPDTIYPLF